MIIDNRPGNALTGGEDLFWLTRAGAELAIDRREKLSAEDFPPPLTTEAVTR